MLQVHVFMVGIICLPVGIITGIMWLAVISGVLLAFLAIWKLFMDDVEYDYLD